jgi:hypothetical protein
VAIEEDRRNLNQGAETGIGGSQLPEAIPDLKGEEIGSKERVQGLSVADAMKEALSSENFIREYVMIPSPNGFRVFSVNLSKTYQPDNEQIRKIGETCLEKLFSNEIFTCEEVSQQGLVNLFKLGLDPSEVMLISKVLTENQYDHPSKQLANRYDPEQFKNATVKPEAELAPDDDLDCGLIHFITMFELKALEIRTFGQLLALTKEDLKLVPTVDIIDVDEYLETKNLKLREECLLSNIFILIN